MKAATRISQFITNNILKFYVNQFLYLGIFVRYGNIENP